MEHTIKNQHDRFILGDDYETISDMLHNHIESAKIGEMTVTVISDYRRNDFRETVVNVERVEE